MYRLPFDCLLTQFIGPRGAQQMRLSTKKHSSQVTVEAVSGTSTVIEVWLRLHKIGTYP